MYWIPLAETASDARPFGGISRGAHHEQPSRSARHPSATMWRHLEKEPGRAGTRDTLYTVSSFSFVFVFHLNSDGTKPIHDLMHMYMDFTALANSVSDRNFRLYGVLNFATYRGLDDTSDVCHIPTSCINNGNSLRHAQSVSGVEWTCTIETRDHHTG